MKTRALLILAGLTFAVSHGLPAYGDAIGFSCLGFCWEVLGENPGGRLGAWLYYGAFVPTNALFVVLLILGLTNDRWLRVRLVLSAIQDVIAAGLAARQTASIYLKELVALKVLNETTFGREKLFIHPKLMQLLTKDRNEFARYG